MDKDNEKINVYICIDSNMIEILLSEKASFLVESVAHIFQIRFKELLNDQLTEIVLVCSRLRSSIRVLKALKTKLISTAAWINLVCP